MVEELQYRDAAGPGDGHKLVRGTSYLIVRRAVEAGRIPLDPTAKGVYGERARLARSLGITRPAVGELVRRVREDIGAGR